MTGKDIAWNHEGGAYEQTEAIRRHIGVGAYCGDERDPDPFHRRNLLCRRRRPAGTGLIPGGGNGGERYDCFGRVSGIDDKYDPGSLSGTISRSYVYDALDHVTQITCAMGNDQREQYGYIYDAAGRITAETSAAAYPVNGTTCSLQKSLAYAYDAAGRLTAVTGSRQEAGITTAVNRQYEYDAAGNRTRQTDGNIVTEYSYNSLDQMTQAVSRQGETLISDITCLYDVDGNQIREEDSVQNTVTTLAYDPADQLTRVTKTENNVQTLVQENRYDGDGQRISKNVQT